MYLHTADGNTGSHHLAVSVRRICGESKWQQEICLYFRPPTRNSSVSMSC